MERKEELLEIFKGVEENQLRLITPLIDEIVFLEDMMHQLKKLPFIRVHPKNPQKQETTPAAKQYKEMNQSYMNAIRILCSILSKNITDDYDPVAEFMEKFKDAT